jgi:arylsulfatase A-like enzyme
VLRRAVVHDAWKLIQVDEQAAELFDLAADPAELTNVVGENSAETHALDAHLRHFTGLMLAQRGGLTDGGPVDLSDEALLRQLRGLGYVE